MSSAGDILFSKINALPAFDKKAAAEEILSVDTKLTFVDPYRNIRMVPLMTKDARVGNVSNSTTGDFKWVDFAPKIIVDWFEDHVFPWTGTRARVMALVTNPSVANYEHIDCNKAELNTRQHKFRVVLQGRTDTLYWLTNKGRVYAPDINEAFIMDGGWPHGMTNTDDVPKVTLALGAPWAGKDDYGSDLTLLQNRNDYSMPDDMEHLWNKK
jgi:hypothetical protein